MVKTKVAVQKKDYAECQALLKKTTEFLEKKTKRKFNYFFTAREDGSFFKGPSFTDRDVLFFKVYEKGIIARKVISMKIDLGYNPYEGTLFIHVHDSSLTKLVRDTIINLTSGLSKIFDFVRVRYFLE